MDVQQQFPLVDGSQLIMFLRSPKPWNPDFTHPSQLEPIGSHPRRSLARLRRG